MAVISLHDGSSRLHILRCRCPHVHAHVDMWSGLSELGLETAACSRCLGGLNTIVDMVHVDFAPTVIIITNASAITILRAHEAPRDDSTLSFRLKDLRMALLIVQWTPVCQLASFESSTPDLALGHCDHVSWSPKCLGDAPDQAMQTFGGTCSHDGNVTVAPSLCDRAKLIHLSSIVKSDFGQSDNKAVVQ